MHTHTRTQVHTANLKLSQLQQPTNAPMGVSVCVMLFSILRNTRMERFIHATPVSKQLGRHDGPRVWVTIGSPVTGSSLPLAPRVWATMGMVVDQFAPPSQVGCAVSASSHRLLRGQRAGGWLLFPGRPRRNLSQKATDKVKYQRGGETQLIYKPPPPSDWAGDVVIQTLNVALPFITTTSLSLVTPTTTLKQ